MIVNLNIISKISSFETDSQEKGINSEKYTELLSTISSHIQSISSIKEEIVSSHHIISYQEQFNENIQHSNKSLNLLLKEKFYTYCKEYREDEATRDELSKLYGIDENSLEAFYKQCGENKKEVDKL